MSVVDEAATTGGSDQRDDGQAPAATALPYIPTPEKPGRRTIVLTIVALVLMPFLFLAGALVKVGVQNWMHTQQRGSANPGAHRGSLGTAVTLADDASRPASWAVASLASGTAGTTTATAADLTIVGTGRTDEGDQTGQLVATDKAGQVVWRSERHRSGVVGVWADGDRVYSFWRRTDDTNVLLDEAAVTTTDMFVVLDARTGKELWWVPTYDDSGSDRFGLPYDVEERPRAELLTVPGSVALAVRADLGPSYVVVFDPDARTARWHAAAVCNEEATATALRLACEDGYATADLVTGQPVP